MMSVNSSSREKITQDGDTVYSCKCEVRHVSRLHLTQGNSCNKYQSLWCCIYIEIIKKNVDIVGL